MVFRVSYTLIIISLIALQVVLLSCRRHEVVEENPSSGVTQTEPIRSDAMLPFGNPSKSTAGDDADNYLVVHRSHVLSYNNSRGTLNWVAWRTRRTDLGERRERPDFEADKSLPRNFKRARYYDYSGSGYQRGHMLPSADRFADAELNGETFLMTNIVPQEGDLNEFPWERLESHARSLVYRGGETYTIAGVYGDRGKLKDKVTVPTNCWKVIVVFTRGQSADAINTRTQIIAVDMPNIDGIDDEPWQKFITSIDAIEVSTGLDLFDLLPDDVENAIEARLTKPSSNDKTSTQKGAY
ncbi:MAG: DNA/RNA non-specific endonuclease [Pyrinomonadaceae bacterium]